MFVLVKQWEMELRYFWQPIGPTLKPTFMQYPAIHTNYITVRQPTARGPDPARDVILSGPPSHLSKIKIYHVR